MPRILVCSLLVAATLHQTPAPQQPLTFRTGVDLVAVDFLAVDKDGRPVADLRAGDVELKVDGRARAIKALQYIAVGDPDASTATAAPALPMPYATNTGDAGGRVVLFVIDEDHLHSANAPILINGAQQFLDTLKPGDRASVLTIPNVRVLADLTTNRDQVRKSLSGIAGRASEAHDQYNIGIVEAIAIAQSADPKQHPFTVNLATEECKFSRSAVNALTECLERNETVIAQQAKRMTATMELATRTLFSSLVDLLSGLSTIEGPKTLVFVSEGVVSFPDTADTLIDVSRAAGAARVQLYVIQPNVPSTAGPASVTNPGSTGGLQTDTGRSRGDDLDLQLAGLSDVASALGGQLFRLSGTADSVIRRISRETSAYYMLGFAPDDAERNGKSHRIELRVARPGISVRARPEFTIPKSGADAVPTPQRIVRDLSAYRELPLRVGAYVFRGPDSAHVKVVVVTETPDASRKFSSVAYALFDDTGKGAAEWTSEAALLSAPIIISATSVAPGAYRLRVAASDGGTLGAADYSLNASIPSTPIATSDLMLGVMTSSGGFAPKLDFTGADQVTGYFELYAAQLPADTSVALEICKAADGPAITGATASIGKTADTDRFVARGTIAIGTVPPGDYVVRARITVGGASVATVTRTLRK